MGIKIILACGQIIDRVIFQQDSSAQGSILHGQRSNSTL